MVKSILKTVLFVCVVLLLGQIRVQRNTIAGLLTKSVLKLFAAGEDEFKGSQLVAELAKDNQQLMTTLSKHNQQLVASLEKTVGLPESAPAKKVTRSAIAPSRLKAREASVGAMGESDYDNDAESVTHADQEKLLQLLQ